MFVHCSACGCASRLPRGAYLGIPTYTTVRLVTRYSIRLYTVHRNQDTCLYIVVRVGVRPGSRAART